MAWTKPQVIIPLEAERKHFIRFAAGLSLILLAVAVNSSSAWVGIACLYFMSRTVSLMLDEINALRAEREMVQLLERRMYYFNGIDGLPVQPWPCPEGIHDFE